MKKVPLTLNYDNFKAKGILYFDKDMEKLLASDEYIIAPAFQVEETEMKEGKRVIKKAKLMEVSIIPWRNYDKKQLEL